MKTFYLFMFSVAFIGFCKAAPSQVKEDLTATHRRRFLFQSVIFCFGPCNLKCAAGYQKSQMGCYNCACAGSQSYALSYNLSNDKFLPSNFSLNAGHIGQFLSNPCDPSVRHCPLQCSSGYKQGVNGCEMCACVKPTLTQLTAYPLTALAKITKPTKAIPTSVSNTKAPLAGRSTLSNLLQNTTTTMISGYFDPCIPTQTVCELDCHGDYVLGPERCQYCLCADKIPPHLRPTTTKAPANLPGLSRSNTSLTNSSKVVSKPTSEACIMAKVICNEKCPGGFVSKPDDCLFCSCLANAEPSDEIARVTLRKPCLYRRQSCKTKCTKGYIKGPRNCQFCSCMKR